MSKNPLLGFAVLTLDRFSKYSATIEAKTAYKKNIRNLVLL